MSKYRIHNLLPVLRLFTEARNRAVEIGFTDNGGAIHSVERVLDILGQRVRYPHLRHISTYKSDPSAEISLNAEEARRRGEPVYVEHVAPQRALARAVIALINEGVSDEAVVDLLRERYRLVLLTLEEMRALNRLNRSQLTLDRIAEAGIQLAGPRAKTP